MEQKENPTPAPQPETQPDTKPLPPPVPIPPGFKQTKAKHLIYPSLLVVICIEIISFMVITTIVHITINSNNNSNLIYNLTMYDDDIFRIFSIAALVLIIQNIYRAFKTKIEISALAMVLMLVAVLLVIFNITLITLIAGGGFHFYNPIDTLGTLAF